MNQKIFYVLNFIIVFLVSVLLAKQINRLVGQEVNSRDLENLKTRIDQTVPLLSDRLQLLNQDIVRVAQQEAYIHGNYYSQDIQRSEITSEDFKESAFLAMSLLTLQENEVRLEWQSLQAQGKNVQSNYFFNQAWQGLTKVNPHQNYYWFSVEDRKGEPYWVYFVKVENLVSSQSWKKSYVGVLFSAEYFYNWALPFKGQEDGEVIVINDQKRALVHSQVAYSGQDLSRHPLIEFLNFGDPSQSRMEFSYKENESWVGDFRSIPGGNLKLVVDQKKASLNTWGVVLNIIPFFILLGFIGIFHERILNLLGYSVKRYSDRYENARLLELTSQLESLEQEREKEKGSGEEAFNKKISEVEHQFSKEFDIKMDEFKEKTRDALRGRASVVLGQIQILKAKTKFNNFDGEDFKNQLQKIEEEVRSIRALQIFSTENLEFQGVDEQGVVEKNDTEETETTVHSVIDNSKLAKSSDLLADETELSEEDLDLLVEEDFDFVENPSREIKKVVAKESHLDFEGLDLEAWVSQQKEIGFDPEKSEIFMSEKTLSEKPSDAEVLIRSPRKRGESIEH
ncbi:MAG: hypothetical protein KDD50_11985 [Bdellovibrionales bacterium]|nr:hypothetical protein [Bdellovibrionales bacterium]